MDVGSSGRSPEARDPTSRDTRDPGQVRQFPHGANLAPTPALRIPWPRPLGYLISSDPRLPAPRVSPDPPPHVPSDPGRRAHVASDPGPATLTAFFMVAAILDWTTGRRGRPSG